MFRVLERPFFSAAQNALFPVYFTIQTALPAVMALTFPGSASPFGVQESSLVGLADESNRWSALVPIATMFVTGLANLVVILPKTQKVMAARYAQGKRFNLLLSVFVSWLLMGLHREEGREEELRPGAALAGDARPQQVLWQAARPLHHREPCGLHRHRVVRILARRAPRLGTRKSMWHVSVFDGSLALSWSSPFSRICSRCIMYRSAGCKAIVASKNSTLFPPLPPGHQKKNQKKSFLNVTPFGAMSIRCRA